MDYIEKNMDEKIHEKTFHPWKRIVPIVNLHPLTNEDAIFYYHVCRSILEVESQAWIYLQDDVRQL
jgi:hypothetical protein